MATTAPALPARPRRHASATVRSRSEASTGTTRLGSGTAARRARGRDVAAVAGAPAAIAFTETRQRAAEEVIRKRRSMRGQVSMIRAVGGRRAPGPDRVESGPFATRRAVMSLPRMSLLAVFLLGVGW